MFLIGRDCTLPRWHRGRVRRPGPLLRPHGEQDVPRSRQGAIPGK